MKPLILAIILALALSAPAWAQDSLVDSWSKVMDAATEALSKTLDEASDALGKAADATSDALSKAAEAASDALGEASEALKPPKPAPGDGGPESAPGPDGDPGRAKT